MKELGLLMGMRKQGFRTNNECRRSDGAFHEGFGDSIRSNDRRTFSNLSGSLINAPFFLSAKKQNSSCFSLVRSISASSLRCNFRLFERFSTERLSCATSSRPASPPRGRSGLCGRPPFQIEKLVKRLDPMNPDPEDQRWRKLVIDVRQHVNFTAYEMDEAGNVLETYLSGSGKSGGQRQKLTTTCLAAALRYQLGNSEEGLPVFAPVILDEAFDKADSDFTDLSMNIFRRFGFQMIVATPEKSIVTLEPYIGGAFYVVMKDRMHSSGLSVRYDEETQKLDFEHMNDFVEEPKFVSGPKRDERPPREKRPKTQESPAPGLFDEFSLFD